MAVTDEFHQDTILACIEELKLSVRAIHSVCPCSWLHTHACCYVVMCLENLSHDHHYMVMCLGNPSHGHCYMVMCLGNLSHDHRYMVMCLGNPSHDHRYMVMCLGNPSHGHDYLVSWLVPLPDHIMRLQLNGHMLLAIV